MMKIPNGWKPYELGKAVNFNPQIKLQRGEQYSFIEMDDVNPADKYVKPKEKKVYDSSSCSKFKNGDTLFARITPCLDNKKIGTAFIGEGQYGFGSTEFIILREKDGLTVQEYVHYLSKSEYIVQNAINSYVGASGRQRADAKFIKKVVIPLPKIPEQQRIASILSAYDDLIENNNKRITILEQMAEQIYKEWFVRMRFPGYENAEFEKGVPKGWEITKVEKAFRYQAGGTPAKDVQEYWNDGDVNWFTPTDITESKSYFLESSSDKCNEFGVSKSSAKLFPAYSLMMTSRATIGEIGINTTVACTNQGFITCIPNKRLPLPFLFYWLKLNKNFFISLSTGATFGELTKSTFKRIGIIIPDEKVTKKYNELVAPMFKQIEILQKENQILKLTRDLLLPRLISGKLRVKDLETVTKKGKV